MLAHVYQVYHVSGVSTLLIGAGWVPKPIPSNSFPEEDVGWLHPWVSVEQIAMCLSLCTLCVTLYDHTALCNSNFKVFMDGTVIIILIYFWCCTPDVLLSSVSQSTTWGGAMHMWPEEWISSYRWLAVFSGQTACIFFLAVPSPLPVLLHCKSRLLFLGASKLINCLSQSINSNNSSVICSYQTNTV